MHSEASFSEGKRKLPGYAYNTNRKAFDELLLKTALDEGTILYEYRAKVEAKGDLILLNQVTMEKCADVLDAQPDFIIDASGRRRVLSNQLKLSTTKGERMDTAMFAHIKEADFKVNKSDIHMHLATKGWCWRIPLQGRTSVGVVVNKKKLQEYGSTLEEQFDNYLANDPKLRSAFKGAERISEIQKYSNYQLQSNRVVGENWALIGDAAGFLDPVFSSGLYFSMKYSSELAKALDDEPNYSFKQYQSDWDRELKSWKKMIELWYNGRLFTNTLMGNDRLDSFMGKRIGNHAIKHFTSIFTGEAVLSRYSMWLLSFMTGPLLDFMYFMRMHRYKVKDLEL